MSSTTITDRVKKEDLRDPLTKLQKLTSAKGLDLWKPTFDIDAYIANVDQAIKVLTDARALAVRFKDQPAAPERKPNQKVTQMIELLVDTGMSREDAEAKVDAKLKADAAAAEAAKKVLDEANAKAAKKAEAEAKKAEKAAAEAAAATPTPEPVPAAA